MDENGFRIILGICILALSLSLSWIFITIQGILQEVKSTVSKFNKIAEIVENGIVSPAKKISDAVVSLRKLFHKENKGGKK